MESIYKIAVFVEKGGVGKTTSAAHIAVAAAQEHDLDVLIVDLAGVQNDIATHFGLEIAEAEDIRDVIDAPISAVFGDDWDFIRDNVDNILDRMTFESGEGPDVIPADPGLGGADNNLANVSREERFEKLDAFVNDLVADEYDLLVLDLPGKEDNIALNGLFAAENVVTPLKPGEFEREQLRRLDDDLATLASEYPVDPELAQILPTMVTQTESLSETFVAELETAYPDRTAPAIAKTANIATAQANGRTLFAVDDLYDTGRRAREAYRTATGQLLTRLSNNE